MYIYIIKITQKHTTMTTMTTQEMTNTVIARVNEMKQNVEIQKIMMGFKTNDEAYDWLVKAAIATLMGVQFAK